MWIFTKYGFFSAVCAKKNGGMSREIDNDSIMVRARSKEHIENLQNRFAIIKNCEISEFPSADYRFRIFVSKKLWSKILEEISQETNYSNFKNEVSNYVSKNNGDYAYVDCLHDVWSIMYEFQNRS